MNKVMINITLPDGSVREYESGVTALDVAKSISEGLARNVLSATVNGEVLDLNRAIDSPPFSRSSRGLVSWYKVWNRSRY